MKNKILHFLVAALTITSAPTLTFAQAPNLGSAASFVIFTTTGAIGNTGISQITGDVGTNNGGTTGYGNVNGVMHSGDGATASAANSLQTAYNQINSTTATGAHAPLLGNGETLFAGVYDIAGQTTLSNTLTLDAQGNANAVFIFKISAVFNSNSNSQVILKNGAQACKVFWRVEGAVNLGSLSEMKGTIIANNGAIGLASGVKLEGRLLSTAGAVTGNGTTAKAPIGCGSPLLTGPTAPNLASTTCYALFSGNGDVANSGNTNVTGDIGTNVGLTTGYNPLLVNGTIHPQPDGSTAAAAADLGNVRTYLNALTPDIELLYPAQFGRNLVLTPHTYILNGGTSLTDTLILNAEGNSDGVFVIKINGALSTSTYSAVMLINGAQSKNVYWMINGASSISDYSDFKGTMVVNNGAIDIRTGVKLDGRAMTTVGAFSSASDVANITASCSTLPLTLLNFSGNVQFNNGILNWKTADEQNTTAFEIQQGMDGKSFIKIGSVKATGTAAGSKDYTYTATNINTIAPVVYYRLKINDADGKFTYSNTVILQTKGNSAVKFYPNPVKETAVLTISVERKEVISYSIIDNAGKVLHSQQANLSTGSNNIKIDVQNLANGLYFISVKGTQTNKKVQFVKQ